MAVAIICQCHGVSDRKVRRAIHHGARTIEELGELCGAGTRCGGCHPNLMALLPDSVPLSVGDVALRPTS
jgi:bacterioferritin-associated ferredoxin